MKALGQNKSFNKNEAVTYRVMSVAGDVSVAWHIWRGCAYRIFEASGCGELPMTDTEELGPIIAALLSPVEVPATEGLMLRRRMLQSTVMYVLRNER